jgi:hypothetical protein
MLLSSRLEGKTAMKKAAWNIQDEKSYVQRTEDKVYKNAYKKVKWSRYAP